MSSITYYQIIICPRYDDETGVYVINSAKVDKNLLKRMKKEVHAYPDWLYGENGKTDIHDLEVVNSYGHKANIRKITRTFVYYLY